MAKKIFCDICGNEMDYSEIADHLKNQLVPVVVKGRGNKTLQFEVAVRVSPVGVTNGEHVDVCGECRAYLLDRLDVRPQSERENSYADAQAANKA